MAGRIKIEIAAICLAMAAAPCEYMYQKANERASAFAQRGNFFSEKIKTALLSVELGTKLVILLKRQDVDDNITDKDEFLLDERKDKELKTWMLLADRDFSDVVVESIQETIRASGFSESKLSCAYQMQSALDKFYLHTRLQERPAEEGDTYENIDWDRVTLAYVLKSGELRGDILENGSNCMTEARMKMESDAVFWRYLAIFFLSLAAFTTLISKLVELREGRSQGEGA